MIFSALLNYKVTFRQHQLQQLGVPDEVDGEAASDYSGKELQRLHTSIPAFSELVFPSPDAHIQPNEKLLGLAVYVVSFFMWFLLVDQVSFMAAAGANWVLWELWALHNISKLRSFAQYKHADIKATVEEIVAEERADRELCAATEAVITDIATQLSTNTAMTENCDIVTTSAGTMKWVPETVQFHAVPGQPTEREATVVLSFGNDSLVCNISSLESVRNWLTKELERMRSKVKEGTHTHTLLKEVSVDAVLKDFTSQSQQLLQILGNLSTACQLPKKVRPRVCVYGRRLPEGNVLVQALLVSDDTGDHLTQTNVQPIVVLTRTVRQHLAKQGAHPTLLAA